MGFLEKLGTFFIGKSPEDEDGKLKSPEVTPEQKWKTLNDQIYALKVMASRDTGDRKADEVRMNELKQQITDVEARCNPAVLATMKEQAETRKVQDEARWDTNVSKNRF